MRKNKPSTSAPVSRAQSPASSSAASATPGPSTPVDLPLSYPYTIPSCLSPPTNLLHNLQPLPYSLTSAPPTVFAFDKDQLATPWPAYPAADAWPSPPPSAAGVQDFDAALFGGGNVYAGVPLSAPAALSSFDFSFGVCGSGSGAGLDFLPTPPLSAASPSDAGGFPFLPASSAPVYEQFPLEAYAPQFECGAFGGLDGPSPVVTIESPFGAVPDASALGEALAWDFHQQQQQGVAGATPTFGYEFLQ